MKRFHPSPALVISLIALFVALGGTSYAAITSLPANSVGTKQLKNGAVTSAKLNAAVLREYINYGGNLPSGMTETGDWGFGSAAGADGGGSSARLVMSFPVPLAAVLDDSHTIYAGGASATHCSGPGHADAGYLCVYKSVSANVNTLVSGSIYDPEVNGQSGTGTNGWAISVDANAAGSWFVHGTWAVTAP